MADAVGGEAGAAPFLPTVVRLNSVERALLDGQLVPRLASLDGDDRSNPKIIGQACDKLDAAGGRRSSGTRCFAMVRP